MLTFLHIGLLWYRERTVIEQKIDFNFSLEFGHIHFGGP